LGDELNKLCILLLWFFFSAAAVAQVAGVIAVVNDQPITSFDIDQRITLLQVLNPGVKQGLERRKIGNDLINDVVKISEAKRNHFEATEKELDDRVNIIAKNYKTDLKGFSNKLKARGISMGALRQYIAAQMAFTRLMQVKYKVTMGSADPAAVDRKLATIKAEINGKVAKIMADPRMQPITVMSIMEINFPTSGNDPQVLQSRAIEANQYLSRFKGCGSAQTAASGIFNVQVGKKIDADSRKLPPAMKKLLTSKGPGHAYGPMRGPTGVQVVAFCGSRTLTPPKPNVQFPTRQQIENVVLNDQYTEIESKYVGIMRKTAIIEYKDPSYQQ
jgi:peptidyl-prolyl cis-trans isomerase SurA